MSGPDTQRIGLDDQRQGWLEAAAFVIAVSLLNVLYAYAVATGANVIVFVLYALTGASVAMLATCGAGRDGWEIIKAPQCWIYGSASVALEAVISCSSASSRRPRPVSRRGCRFPHRC